MEIEVTVFEASHERGEGMTYKNRYKNVVGKGTQRKSDIRSARKRYALAE